MPPTTLFGQFDASGMRPESMLSFVAFTLIFLFVTWLVDDRRRPMGTKLILWGILVEILSVGYGLNGTPAVMMATPAMTKIGFLLVLGGLTWNLLADCPVPPARKEADNV